MLKSYGFLHSVVFFYRRLLNSRRTQYAFGRKRRFLRESNHPTYFGSDVIVERHIL